VLEQILSKLTTLHQSERKPSGPSLPLPQVDPKQVCGLAVRVKSYLLQAALHSTALHPTSGVVSRAPRLQGTPQAVRCPHTHLMQVPPAATQPAPVCWPLMHTMPLHHLWPTLPAPGQ
jgi:hypothetical protein